MDAVAALRGYTALVHKLLSMLRKTNLFTKEKTNVKNP